jgi:lactobin A/cerein 7B family class IIb bacteriocin
MQTLNLEQVEEVNGGWVPIAISLVALAVATMGNLDEIEEFGKGFVDGLRDK